MTEFVVREMVDVVAEWRPKRLVCPLCLEDTATAYCFGCGVDWADGLSDWLIRPRKNTLGDDWLRERFADRPLRRNATWRKYWRKQGELRCSWCDVTEVDAPGTTFDIDHVEPVAEGGADAFGNTRVLCSTCHRLRGTMQAHTRRMRKS